MNKENDRLNISRGDFSNWLCAQFREKIIIKRLTRFAGCLGSPALCFVRVPLFGYCLKCAAWNRNALPLFCQPIFCLIIPLGYSNARIVCLVPGRRQRYFWIHAKGEHFFAPINGVSQSPPLRAIGI